MIFKKGGAVMEEMKPLFAYLDSAERKAYRMKMAGCTDLIPELSLIQI